LAPRAASRRPRCASLEVAPDWVCEIISPSTERIDRGLKLRIYARERVSYLWLVNPDTRTLEVFRLRGGEWVVAAVHTGETPIRVEPFESIELDLKTLWAETQG
jgi:Uma2 family endonuclease